MQAAGTDHPALFSQTFVTGPMHWIKQDLLYTPPEEKFDAMFRFQHKHPLIGCSCKLREDRGYDVTLARPMRAVTPGQYSVFYSEDTCLGSARILSLGPSLHQLGFNTRVMFPLELA